MTLFRLTSNGETIGYVGGSLGEATAYAWEAARERDARVDINSGDRRVMRVTADRIDATPRQVRSTSMARADLEDMLRTIRRRALRDIELLEENRGQMSNNVRQLLIDEFERLVAYIDQARKLY